MIYRKPLESEANILDSLLTKLILDEQKYDPNVEIINVKDFYIHYIKDPTKYFEVCEDDNNIVGYIYSIIENNSIKIDALFVDESYRNKGIASKLIENCINYAKNNNIKTITINVLKDNIKAKNIYYKYFTLNKKEGIKEELIINL